MQPAISAAKPPPLHTAVASGSSPAAATRRKPLLAVSSQVIAGRIPGRRVSGRKLRRHPGRRHPARRHSTNQRAFIRPRLLAAVVQPRPQAARLLLPGAPRIPGAGTGLPSGPRPPPPGRGEVGRWVLGGASLARPRKLPSPPALLPHDNLLPFPSCHPAQVLHGASPHAALQYQLDPEERHLGVLRVDPRHGGTLCFCRRFTLGHKGDWWRVPLDTRVALSPGGEQPHGDPALKRLHLKDASSPALLRLTVCGPSSPACRPAACLRGGGPPAACAGPGGGAPDRRPAGAPGAQRGARWLARPACRNVPGRNVLRLHHASACTASMCA